MGSLKVTTWNVEYLDKLLNGSLNGGKRARLEAIAQEIKEMSPDILCVVEGPKGEAAVDQFTSEVLGGDYVAVKAASGDYGIQGDQWVWFLVKAVHQDKVSLLPPATWDSLCGGKSWEVHYWGDQSASKHSHFRHPQVMVLDWQGQRVEFIGLHLKSKFVNKDGESDWKAGGERQAKFIEAAIKARIKMTTEAVNVRKYIDAKFQ